MRIPLLRRLRGRSTIRLNPPVFLMLLYAALILAGSAVLMTPAATPEPIRWSDAIFTATSAVTVTGLVVLDTGTDFTPFGQGVIALLIQLGGLGLMTFAIQVLSMLGQPIGITQQIILRDELGQTSLRDLLSLVRTIVKIVLVCEIAGAVLLASVFVPEFGWAHGVWSAVFHSISAFNNAGFSLYADSLTRWAGDPVVNLTIPVMFICGGLGYAVFVDLLSRRPWRSFALHSKLMLVGTPILIVWSVVAFAVLEWNNPATLGGIESLSERLWTSWMQGVTTRTAGFNSTDIAGIGEDTALMFISLMFIGGGSTSTAGGIKLTTAIVVLLATVAFFKRRDTVIAFGRGIALEKVFKVMAITTVAILFVMTGTFLLVTTQEGDFLDLFFEAVSAFATVGLSRGATGGLDDFGRAVIDVMMFFGRVGPLTVGFLLATRLSTRIEYPEGRIYLG